MTPPLAPPLEGPGGDTTVPFPAGRFLSEAESHALYARVCGFAHGGGDTALFIGSAWTGNLRWARNGIISSGDVRRNRVSVARIIRGAIGESRTNALDDRRLRWAVRRAERQLDLQHEPFIRNGSPAVPSWPRPKIWFDTTYHQTAEERAAIMERVVRPAREAGMLSAGYIQVEAMGRLIADPVRLWYYPYTWAQYTVTVRSPDGTGSGWAGVDWNDWNRIDAEKLSAIALDKCLRSRNPVRLEPGRYTAILEPQAVGDLVQSLFSPVTLERSIAEGGDPQVLRTDPRYKPHSKGVYNDGPGYSKLGQQVFDTRLTVRTDNMDPDLGFPPFLWHEMRVYRPGTWITNGVLTALSGGTYTYTDDANPSQYGASGFTGAFRMSVTGETVSVEEMIATTKRGVLVTRFGRISGVPGNDTSGILTGYTRDGLWLVENGKVTKAVKNFRFTESPVYVLNNIEQLGVPQRIFSPGYPIIVPALKVRDFSFTALTDAV